MNPANTAVLTPYSESCPSFSPLLILRQAHIINCYCQQDSDRGGREGANTRPTFELITRSMTGGSGSQNQRGTHVAEWVRVVRSAGVEKTIRCACRDVRMRVSPEW